VAFGYLVFSLYFEKIAFNFTDPSKHKEQKKIKPKEIFRKKNLEPADF